MPSYLVETYVPRCDAPLVSERVARARAAARALSRKAAPVRLLRSTFVPDDELCFLLFEAPSAAAVVELGARAAMQFERVVEAFDGRSPATATAPDRARAVEATQREEAR